MFLENITYSYPNIYIYMQTYIHTYKHTQTYKQTVYRFLSKQFFNSRLVRSRRKSHRESAKYYF